MSSPFLKKSPFSWDICSASVEILKCGNRFFLNIGICAINPHYDLCNKDVTEVASWEPTGIIRFLF